MSCNVSVSDSIRIYRVCELSAGELYMLGSVHRQPSNQLPCACQVWTAEQVNFISLSTPVLNAMLDLTQCSTGTAFLHCILFLHSIVVGCKCMHSQPSKQSPCTCLDSRLHQLVYVHCSQNLFQLRGVCHAQLALQSGDVAAGQC